MLQDSERKSRNKIKKGKKKKKRVSASSGSTFLENFLDTF